MGAKFDPLLAQLRTSDTTDISGLVPKTTTVNGHPLSSNVVVTATDVGLGNVDNTSDVNKPVSTAQATADGLRVLKAGDTMTGTLNTQNLIPATTATYSLGDASHYLTNAYASQLNLSSVANINANTINLQGSSVYGNFVNTSSGQYSSAGFTMYNATSTMGTWAGVHMATNILSAGGTANTGNFAIDLIDYTGAYVTNLMNFNLASGNIYASINSALTIYGQLNMFGDISLSTHNLVTDTTTGTKIGATTNQKLGFFGSTPVVQQTGDIVTALSNLGLVTSGTTYPKQAPTVSAPAYVKGGLYFDTTLNKLRIGGATAWETVTSV